MTSFRTLLAHYKHLIFYGVGLALLLFLLKWLEWKFLIRTHSLDIYIGLIAAFFTMIGIWLASQLIKTKTIIVEKEIVIDPNRPFSINEKELQKLNLTSREWDVLQLMAKGKSNSEIAEGLHLSLSTVKTHASNLFVKMHVKSRTQAMEKAKRLKIIA